VSPLLIGGEDLGRKYRNNIGRGSTPFVFSELGSYGNIGMLVFLMGCLQICSRLSRLFRDESLIWRFSGAKGLAALYPGRIVEQV